jgi:apyrase
LGGGFKDTVAAIDLGGGSVQEAFAVEEDKEVGQSPPGHVVTIKSGGKKYLVYVHR